MIDQAITAGLVGIVMGLIKLVEYLVKRNGASKVASPYNGSTDKIVGAADKLHDASIRMEITTERLERIADKMER